MIVAILSEETTTQAAQEGVVGALDVWRGEGAQKEPNAFAGMASDSSYGDRRKQEVVSEKNADVREVPFMVSVAPVLDLAVPQKKDIPG